MGQTLSADVSFEQIATDGADNIGGNADDVRAVRIGVANLSITLGGGAVTVTNGSGALFLTSNGTQSTIAARLTATIGVSIPGVSLIGTLGLRINTGATEVNETFMVGTTPVNLQVPGGPFLEISGTGIQIEIAGQRISGNFTVRQQTDATGARTLRINVANGSLTLGGATPVVSVTNVAGDILVVTGGVAANLSGNVAVTVPGVGLSASIQISINTTLASQAVGLVTLPAGPYLRVTGTNLSLTVAGQTLVGNFTFEKVTRTDGTAVVRVGAANVHITLGGVVAVTNGTGFFLITPSGIAGQVSASVALTGITGVSFSGTFGLAINNTASEIDERIQVGAATVRLVLPIGPYLRVEGTGILLTIAGQSLSGNVAFEQLTGPNGAFVKVALSEVELAIGDGTKDLLTVSNGQGAVVIYPATPLIVGDREGIAGSFSGDLALHIPGITLSASVQVDINRTGFAVHETFTVGGQPLTLDLGAGTYTRVAVNDAVLAFAGLSLTGDFTFEQGGGIGTRRAILVGEGATCQFE